MIVLKSLKKPLISEIFILVHSRFPSALVILNIESENLESKIGE